MNQSTIREENNLELAGALRNNEESSVSKQSVDTTLTRENLARVDSSLENSGVSGPRSLSEGGIKYGSNSSGLSKVSSREGLNSAGLSDMYVSSDAETEKLDLEEDQSRASLSHIVETLEKEQSQRAIKSGDESLRSDLNDSSMNGSFPKDNGDIGCPEKLLSHDLPISENHVSDVIQMVAKQDTISNGVDNKDSPGRRLDDESMIAEHVFKKPRLPTELKVENSPGFQVEGKEIEPTTSIQQETEKLTSKMNINEDARENDISEDEMNDKNEGNNEENVQKTNCTLENEEDEVEAEEEDDEEEEEDAIDERDSQNGIKLSPMEKEQLRQDALKALTRIEIDFAQLRQTLYENKLTKLQSELQMCLDGSHPQLQSYYQKIDSIRDLKLKQVYQKQKYELDCINKETKCTRISIHQEFYKKVSDLRHTLLSHTTQRWYDINKERREMDVVVPEVKYHVPIKVTNKSLSCITGYAAPAKMRRPGDGLSEDLVCENIKFRFQNNPVDKLEVIVDRMRFNNELSDLKGLKKYYGGFPGAPDLGGLKESEIYDDLSGIHQNQQQQLEQQHRLEQQHQEQQPEREL